MLTRYDNLEAAFENRGVSFHRLWKLGAITRNTYVKLREGIPLTDEEIAMLAEGASTSIDYVKSLIVDSVDDL